MLIYTAATITALSVIATAWVKVGGPVPASQLYVTQSGEVIKDRIQKVEVDGKKQTEESAKWGRKIYSQELNSLLIHDPPRDPQQRQIFLEQIEHSRKWKKFYSDKDIELRKK